MNNLLGLSLTPVVIRLQSLMSYSEGRTQIETAAEQVEEEQDRRSN
jgi:hypothetical protein